MERRGLQPTRIVDINDKNNMPHTTLKEQHQRWRRHFSSVLDVGNQFDMLEVESVCDREDVVLGRVPTAREITKALRERMGKHLKLGYSPRNAEGGKKEQGLYQHARKADLNQRGQRRSSTRMG